MKFDVTTLFQIETNCNFSWQTLSGCGDPGVVENYRELMTQVIPQYPVQCSGEAFWLSKRNRESAIYKIAGENGCDYVFRCASRAECKTLEVQCHTISEMSYPRMIQPVLSRNGNRVTATDRQVWIVYPYREGTIFEGNEKDLMRVFEECFRFLGRLKEISPPDGLPGISYSQTLWKQFSDFIESGEFSRMPLRNFIDESRWLWTEHILGENRSEIRALIERAAAMDLDSGMATTHHDLNHANILMTESGPFFLDLEAVVWDSLPVSAAHCIFKLLRHCVYRGYQTVAQIKTYLLPEVLRLAAKYPLGIRSEKDFFWYGQARIISDIHMILEKILIRKKKPTDFTKKIMNLFELYCFVGEETPWI